MRKLCACVDLARELQNANEHLIEWNHGNPLFLITLTKCLKMKNYITLNFLKQSLTPKQLFSSHILWVAIWPGPHIPRPGPNLDRVLARRGNLNSRSKRNHILEQEKQQPHLTRRSSLPGRFPDRICDPPDTFWTGHFWDPNFF